MNHARSLVLSSLLIAASPSPCQKTEPTPTPAVGRDLGRIDVDRIRELHHLTDVLGDELWPGFDTRRIPVAVNNDDRQELLIGHPSPPKEFEAFRGHEIDGKPVMIRAGVTRYGPRGGGWAVRLGGEHTAYVSVLGKGQSTERYLSLLLHECFHVYQRRYRARGQGRLAPLPTDDPVYAAMIGLESRILHAALGEEQEEKLRELCRMFVAVRHERRKSLSAGIVRNEGAQEYNEGTATYIQARLFQLLAKRGGIKPVVADGDARYKGFVGATARYRTFRARVLPATTRPITFFHSQYQNGMAQCLLLDRVRPKWKEEMRERGRTQFDLFEREFPIEEREHGALRTGAGKRFGHDELLAAQKKLVGDRLAKIKSLLHTEGRRYRVYHSAIRGRFKWKPRGPVYNVPASLLGDEAEAIVIEHEHGTSRILDPNVTIWGGGIRRFEKGGLLFESGAVPVLFRPDYLEWIDTDPDAEGKDFEIRSKRVVDGVHHELKITTDGFTLSVDRARVEKSDDVVTVHPVVGR